MKRKVFCILLVVLLPLLMTIGCSTDSESADKKVVLKYAHPNAPDTTVGRFADGFAKLVEERTEGRIKVEVFPNSELGSVNTMIEGVKAGTIEMGHNDFAAIAVVYPDIAVFNAPYLYRDAEHAIKAMSPATSEVLREFNEKLISNANMRIIGSAYYGYRHLTASSPVKTPADLNGKKIRAIPVPVWLAMVEGMGAIPTPVDFSELPTALATGVVVGQENPLTTIVNNHFYETQKYLMTTGHMLAYLAVHINENVWQKLSPDDQRILEEAATEMSIKSTEWGVAEEEENIRILKEKGMIVITEDDGLDNEAFKKAVDAKIKEKFPNWTDWITRIQNIK